MINVVKDFLNKYDIKNKPVVIAFSAGPDSCALTRLLLEIKDEFNIEITIAYFNHMWRKEAELEEKFSAEFADKYYINCVIGRAPLNIPINEETAREYRYNFLEETANKLNCDTVFLAHNKNDNIETLLYRIIKGTSVKGMCSIPEYRDIFFRPLLKIEKKDILKYLKTVNQNYMIDSSNYDTKYKRNFIRQEIIPLIKKVNPNFMNSMDNLITTSNYSTGIIIDSINKIMDEIITDGIIDRNKYLSYKVEYRYEILNSYLGDKLKFRDFKTIKKLDDFIVENPHSKTSLNKYEFLRTRRNKIFIENNIKEEKDEST